MYYVYNYVLWHLLPHPWPWSLPLVPGEGRSPSWIDINLSVFWDRQAKADPVVSSLTFRPDFDLSTRLWPFDPILTFWTKLDSFTWTIHFRALMCYYSISLLVVYVRPVYGHTSCSHQISCCMVYILLMIFTLLFYTT